MRFFIFRQKTALPDKFCLAAGFSLGAAFFITVALSSGGLSKNLPSLGINDNRVCPVTIAANMSAAPTMATGRIVSLSSSRPNSAPKTDSVDNSTAAAAAFAYFCPKLWKRYATPDDMTPKNKMFHSISPLKLEKEGAFSNMSASIHDMAAANKNCSMVSIQISSFFVNTDSAIMCTAKNALHSSVSASPVLNVNDDRLIRPIAIMATTAHIMSRRSGLRRKNSALSSGTSTT